MTKKYNPKTIDMENKATSLQRMGAKNNTSKRERNDFYATDPNAIDLLLKSVQPKGKIYECCCGQGHLSERLKQRGFSVISTDLVNRGYGCGGVDFLKLDKLPDGVHTICTNPPYGISTDIIEHALNLMSNGDEMYMFLKTLYLEGSERYNRIYSQYPPYKVLQFVKRVTCAKNADFVNNAGGGYVSYMWFCWRKGYVGNTILEWLL